MNRAAALSLALGACLAPLPARAQSTRTTLRIGLIPTDVAAQPYYARELGLFEKAGFDLELTPLTNGASIMSAVAGGSLDIGFSNSVALSFCARRTTTHPRMQPPASSSSTATGPSAVQRISRANRLP